MAVDHTLREPRPLWQMAAVDDYCLPADSTPAALRRKWRLLAQLFSRQDQRDTLAQPEATLSSLPPAQLDRLAPPSALGRRCPRL